MAVRHFQDFMLAVAVECRSLNSVGRLGPGLGSTPIERNAMLGMADDQLSSFVATWKADHERAELLFRTWSVDMGFEDARRCGVDLFCSCSKLTLLIYKYIC